jgi:glycosyl transferase family 25
MRLPCDSAFDLEFFAGLREMFIAPWPISRETDFPSDIQLGRKFQLHLRQRLGAYPLRATLEIGRWRLGKYRPIGVR